MNHHTHGLKREVHVKFCYSVTIIGQGSYNIIIIIIINFKWQQVMFNTGALIEDTIHINSNQTESS